MISHIRARCLLGRVRSEEHTSELQSPCNLVCRLLLEKKKNISSRVSLSSVYCIVYSSNVLHPFLSNNSWYLLLLVRYYLLVYFSLLLSYQSQYADSLH